LEAEPTAQMKPFCEQLTLEIDLPLVMR